MNSDDDVRQETGSTYGMREVFIPAKRARKVYHSDAECGYLPDEWFERDEARVKRRGYRECQYCSGELDRPTGDAELVELLERADPSEFDALLE